MLELLNIIRILYLCIEFRSLDCNPCKLFAEVKGHIDIASQSSVSFLVIPVSLEAYMVYDVLH